MNLALQSTLLISVQCPAQVMPEELVFSQEGGARDKSLPGKKLRQGFPSLQVPPVGDTACCLHGGRAEACSSSSSSPSFSLSFFFFIYFIEVQLTWASLVAQMVKNLLAIRETWVQSLGWDDLLEKVMVTHSSILAWRSPMDRGAWWAAVHGVTKSWT